MKIQRICASNFGRKLKPEEVSEYTRTLEEGKKVVGQTGKSILVVHDACLPQSPQRNTGVANLAGTDSEAFFNIAKQYLGINAVEVLPQGQVFSPDGSYCAYSGSSLALGNHEINLERLLSEDYGKILTQEELNKVVASNTSLDKNSIVNWQNVMDNGSPHDLAIRKAFERFKALPDDSPLKVEYSKFYSNNAEWLDKKSIFEILAKKYNSTDPTKWLGENDKKLYSLDDLTRYFRIAEILSQNKDEANFHIFKQFIAEKQLLEAKASLNAKGLKLYGDFPIGFSHDEVWAYPKAFKKDHVMGIPKWQIPALDMDSIFRENSDANKLLKLKLKLAARRYDSLRIDSAWGYIRPIITPKGELSIFDHNRKYFGSGLLDYIEKYLKELRGDTLDVRDLIYEFEAAPSEFTMWENGQLSPAVKDRLKALSTTYMKDKWQDDWGSFSAYKNKGLTPFSLAVGNHDTQPLREIANNIPDPDAYLTSHKQDAISTLSRELHIDRQKLEIPEEFARAKWAEIMQNEHIHMFYPDVFGMKERFNTQGARTKSFFSIKIPANAEESLVKGISEGYGFNPMDALEKLFHIEDRIKRFPDLYASIQKFNNILKEPEQIITPAINDSKSNKYLKAAIAIGALAIAGITGINLYNKKSDKNTNTSEESTVQTQKISMNDFLKNISKKS